MLFYAALEPAAEAPIVPPQFAERDGGAIGTEVDLQSSSNRVSRLSSILDTLLILSQVPWDAVSNTP